MCSHESSHLPRNVAQPVRHFSLLLVLFINIIAEGGGVVVKERTEKRGLLGPRFLIKKRTEQPQLSFTSRTYTHTPYTYIMVKFLKGTND